MNCRQIIEVLEQIAPQDYAESWDNCGMSYGDLEQEVSNILVALEPTQKVIDEAIEKNIDMIITHHPMIFSPVKSLSCDNLIVQKITKLAKNDIVSYSMHTNMDVAVMSKVSADKLDLINVRRLENTIITDGEDLSETTGLGSVGEIKNQMLLGELAELVKDRFNIDSVRVVGDLQVKVNRIAILLGSGKSYIKKAIKEEVDVLITGDIDYHSAIDALEQGICLVDAGHFDTEYFFVDYMYNYLKTNLAKESVKVSIATEKSPFIII